MSDSEDDSVTIIGNGEEETFVLSRLPNVDLQHFADYSFFFFLKELTSHLNPMIGIDCFFLGLMLFSAFNVVMNLKHIDLTSVKTKRISTKYITWKVCTILPETRILKIVARIAIDEKRH